MPLILADLPGRKPLKPLSRPAPAFEKAAGGKVLVAVLAPTPHAWVLVPVRSEMCRLNDAPITQPSRIATYDVLNLGQKSFVVDEASTNASTATTMPEGGLARPTCTVTVRHRNAQVGSTTATGVLVIGTDAGCGLSLPVETKLGAYHAVLAHVDHRWHLFALTDAGATWFGADPPSLTMALVRGESVWLGDAELTLTYDEFDPLDMGYEDESSEGSEETAEPDGDAETAAAVEPETPSSTPSANASFWKTTAVQIDKSDEFQTKAMGLCKWLQAEHARVSPDPRPRTHPGPPLDGEPGDRPGSIPLLEQYAERLAVAPWDPIVLFDAAAALWHAGLIDNARWILKELYRQNPHDAVVAESLGWVMLAAAREARRPFADRIADYQRAQKYVGVAARARPNDIRISELHREIGSELALKELTGNRSTGRGRDSGGSR